MEKYEKFTIKDIEILKKRTVYFYLKRNGFSESFISKLRTYPNSILLNSSPANLKSQIKEFDTLEILNNPSYQTDIALCNKDNLHIIFENEDFLVVNKPHNLACMPSRSHYTENLGGQICAYMHEKDENFVLRIVNRLDKETAGLVVVAKNLIAYNNIKSIYKEYYALCHGNLESSYIKIDCPIKTLTENGINIMKRMVLPDGKPATTHVYEEQKFSNYSLVKCILETGRTHQIRVHLSHIGHSLIGDTLYCQKSLSQNLKNQTNHTMLLLKKVSFINFRDNSNISLEINFPDEWNKFLQ